MYKIISLDHTLKEIFSSPFAFSSAVNDEDHLKMGKICDEIGFVDLAFAHYSAVINNKKADKISLLSKAERFRYERNKLQSNEMQISTLLIRSIL